MSLLNCCRILDYCVLFRVDIYFDGKAVGIFAKYLINVNSFMYIGNASWVWDKISNSTFHFAFTRITEAQAIEKLTILAHYQKFPQFIFIWDRTKEQIWLGMT